MTDTPQVPARIRLTPTQKLHALGHRFYHNVIWTPKAGDFYTTSRPDLELYVVVDVTDEHVFTRYADPAKTPAGPASVAAWKRAEFLDEKGFGYARVYVPEWVFSQVRDVAPNLPDNPEMDGTDFAHPAWWRGEDSGVSAIVREANDLLDGKPAHGVAGHAGWQALRLRLSSLAAAKTG